MVTTKEIEQAVERLNKAGLWAHSNDGFRAEAEKSGSSRVISGSTKPPEYQDFNGTKVRVLRRGEQLFSVKMEESGKRYRAEFRLHQISVTIRIADSFDDVISSLTNYAYLQSKPPQDSISILYAIHQLKQAGLSTQIPNENCIEAKDKLHTFTIHWEDAQWSIKVDDSDKLAAIQVNTLETAVNKVIEFYDIQ